MTEIFKAIENNSIELVKKCIDSGIHLNITIRVNVLWHKHSPYSEDIDFSILHYAIENDCSIELMELLLKNGVDPNFRSNDWHGCYFSPLGLCLTKNKNLQQTIQLLLSYGAHPLQYEYELPKYCPYINYENFKSLVLLGLNYYESEDKMHYINKYLKLVIKAYHELKESTLMVKFLIGQGANINCEINKLKLVEWCIREDARPELIKLLIDNGADINNIMIQSVEGYHNIMKDDTYLMILKLLINHNNVNNCDENGDTILFHSCNPDITRWLIEVGANVNHRNNNGETALHYLSQHKCNIIDTYEIIVNIFLEQNIDLTLKDNEGKTVIDCIKRYYRSSKHRKSIINHIEARIKTGKLKSIN